MDVLKKAYEPIPDNISKKFARRLSEIDQDELRLSSLPSSSVSSNSKKVTFADFREDEEEEERPSFQRATEAEQLRRLDELRNALGRHALTERGISYMLPVNRDRISVENVFRPELSAAFGKEPPRKDAALFNHRPGQVSPRDVPRLCRDISDERRRGGDFISPRGEADGGQVPPEFSLARRYREPVMRERRRPGPADPSSVDIRLPGSSVPSRRRRRSSITIGPRIKELMDSFSRYTDVSEDMDGVPPTRETYGKTRNRESLRTQIPQVMGDEQKSDILKWLDKGDRTVKRK